MSLEAFIILTLEIFWTKLKSPLFLSHHMRTCCGATGQSKRDKLNYVCKYFVGTELIEQERQFIQKAFISTITCV